MTRTPLYLGHKEVPDEELLNKIKNLTKEGKSPRKMQDDLDGISLYIISRYYSKIKRGVW